MQYILQKNVNFKGKVMVFLAIERAMCTIQPEMCLSQQMAQKLWKEPMIWKVV